MIFAEASAENSGNFAENNRVLLQGKVVGCNQPPASLPGGSLATDTRRATPEGGITLEYDALVNFYKQKLRERYRACDPERRRIVELIRRADEETLEKVAELLKKDKS